MGVGGSVENFFVKTRVNMNRREVKNKGKKKVHSKRRHRISTIPLHVRIMMLVAHHSLHVRNGPSTSKPPLIQPSVCIEKLICQIFRHGFVLVQNMYSSHDAIPEVEPAPQVAAHVRARSKGIIKLFEGFGDLRLSRHWGKGRMGNVGVHARGRGGGDEGLEIKFDDKAKGCVDILEVGKAARNIHIIVPLLTAPPVQEQRQGEHFDEVAKRPT